MALIQKIFGLGSQGLSLFNKLSGGQPATGGQTGLASPTGFQPIGSQPIAGVAPAFEDPFNPTLPSGNLSAQDLLTGAQAEMGPTGAEAGSGFGGIPGLGALGTGLGLAGSGLGVAGLLTGNQDLQSAGRLTGTAGAAANTLSGQQNALSLAGGRLADSLSGGQINPADFASATGLVNFGFGPALGAANQANAEYIAPRLGVPAATVSNIIGDIGNMVFPAAGTFAEGLISAIASAFGYPDYATHRTEVGQSIQSLMPIIQAALPQVRSPQDFAELQNVINSQANRWQLTPEGITGGYDVGGSIGAQLNPVFQQALSAVESRPDQPGTFDQWFKDWALQQAMAGLGAPTQPTEWGPSPHPTGLGYLMTNPTGFMAMGPLGLGPNDLAAYVAQHGGFPQPQPVVGMPEDTIGAYGA